MNFLSQVLTLPGNGVFTVHTGKEIKEELFETYYGTKKINIAEKKWLKSLDKIPLDRPIILGIPSDNGGGIHRGANWGPLALRLQLTEFKNNFFDVGDVKVIPHLLHDKYLNSKTIQECQKAIYGKVNKLPVSPLSIAELVLTELYKKNSEVKIMGLGGDHSTSYPLVLSWIKSRKNIKKAGLLHFDAHTDLLNKRMGIDLCFGTWTYHILKELASPEHLLQLGIRASGKTKKYWSNNLKVEQYWAKEIKQWGIEKTLKKIIHYFKKLKIEEIYISFDIDALDSKYASATGTPELHGLLPTDAASIIGVLSNEFKVTGVDLMEVAPFICHKGVDLAERESSLTVAGDIAKLLLNSITT